MVIPILLYMDHRIIEHFFNHYEELLDNNAFTAASSQVSFTIQFHTGGIRIYDAMELLATNAQNVMIPNGWVG